MYEMRVTRIVTLGVLSALAMGLSGCVLPTVTLNNIRPTGAHLADPTAIVKDGTQYTYGTQFFVYRVPVTWNGNTAEALTKKADWATGTYTAAPDVRQFPNGQYLMYFTATPYGSTQNCIGVAVGTDMTHFVPEPRALKCGEVWDPDIEFASGQPVLLFSTTAGIKSVRLTADGRGVAGAETTLLARTQPPTPANTIENPTAFWDGAASQWVMLYSISDWTTIFYQTQMAYCPGQLDQGCNVQGQRGSFPFNQVNAGDAMYGTGGMDLFTGADGQMDAVFHYWKSGDGNRKTGQADVAVTDPSN